MDPSVSRQLKALFAKYEKELMKFGLLPDYYAYALVYAWSMQKPQREPRAKDLFWPDSNN
jgi:hypothetical protein